MSVPVAAALVQSIHSALCQQRSKMSEISSDSEIDNMSLPDDVIIITDSDRYW